MRLLDVYGTPDAESVLYRVLAEREPHQSISHKRMPTWAEHCAFVASRPYAHWYLIDCGDIVGAAYLSHQREIGIGILKCHRGNNYGLNALRLLIQAHPGRLLANINPSNTDSIRLFTGLGFIMIQQTYELA